MSELALQLIREVKEKRLESLDLGNCGLKEVPEELFELTWLRQLNLGFAFQDLYSGKLTQTKNTIGLNRIKRISFKIKKLEKLESIGLSESQITDFSFLKELTNLTTLDLSRNQITDISFLKELTNLTTLNLYNNQITDFSFLKELTNLTTLYLSYNQITDFSFLKELTNLTTLYLSRSQITDISFLKGLTNLTTLYLSENQITDISFLKELTNLATLYLSENQITDISFLKGLTNLTTLYLSRNQITDISFLKGLTNLTTLYLSENQITDISFLKELTNLTTLDLSYNQITDIIPIKHLLEKKIPFKWKNDYSPSGVVLEENPLTIPRREIIEQGNEVILRYFNEIGKGTYKINESRLLIVGQGGSGKTTLRRKLKDADAPLPEPGDTTRGIETEVLDYSLNNQSYKLRIWDFGGQNIQHYAHQFFLTDSSLYVLLTNEREQNPNFQYWLNIIEVLGGKSPVLIVQNEIAGHCEPIRNLAGIRSRYENVVNTVYSTDLSKAKEDARFETLKSEILYRASKLEHVNKEYPASYLNVRNRLDKEVEQQKHFITWSEYRNICKEEGIKEEGLMRDIASTYSVLGICLFLKDDIELRNYIFLNPQWIIGALFGLLYHDIVIKRNGEFSEEDTLTIWNDPVYENMHSKLLRMMERFELCYRIMDSDRFIVPQRLPAAKESYNWDEQDTTKVVYSYQFMPKGIITRITCRLHEEIMGNSAWSDAVIFQNRGAKVFVREVYSEEKISIEAAGDNREELLNRAIDTIDNIHTKTKIANLKVEKLVPCICNQCITSKEPYFFNYDTLRLLMEEGEFDERCQKSRKKVDIREVLHKTGIKLPDARNKSVDERYSHLRNEEQKEEKLKVFLSYSHKDEGLKEELDKHLSALKHSNKISVWNDRGLEGGDNWDETIKEKLRKADFIILLISADFMASEYIWDVEVKSAIECHDKGEAKVIPIFLRECDFKDMPFEKLQGYPKDAQPVTSFSDRDEAFSQVAKGIRRDIEGWRK
jgi:internalin A